MNGENIYFQIILVSGFVQAISEGIRTSDTYQPAPFLRCRGGLDGRPYGTGA